MRIGMAINYADGFREAVAEVRQLEQAGLDVISVPEAYSFDAVSQLGFIAAQTQTISLASGILQIYTRTPTLTAMTAAGLDYVSDGRFILGIGASGPQVIEGFHGVPYDAPVGRIKEIVDICRMVWRRDKLEYQGAHYAIPLPADQGTGLGKPLKLVNRPVRDRIPIVIAALGLRSVAQTAAIAEGWQPIFFHPEKAASVWGDALASGARRRDNSLGPLEVYATPALAIGADAEKHLPAVKSHLALYIGGMGARGANFYNELVRSYGYEAEAEHIQDLYLAGQKVEAAAAVPDDLVRAISLIGTEAEVAARLAAFVSAGVTVLNVATVSQAPGERVRQVGLLRGLLQDIVD